MFHEWIQKLAISGLSHNHWLISLFEIIDRLIPQNHFLTRCPVIREYDSQRNYLKQPWSSGEVPLRETGTQVVLSN